VVEFLLVEVEVHSSQVFMQRERYHPTQLEENLEATSKPGEGQMSQLEKAQAGVM
jgi:hypothetical protein